MAGRESLLHARPRIVADFEYEGHDWLVVDWPPTADEEARFEVYRADLPWVWRHDAEDVR